MPAPENRHRAPEFLEPANPTDGTAALAVDGPVKERATEVEGGPPGELEAETPPSGLVLLLARIAAAPAVWARMAVVRNANVNSWQFAFLEVIVGAKPDGWTEARWAYGQAIFSAIEVPGLEVAQWFAAQELKVGPVIVTLKPQFDVHPERRDSRALGIYQPLAWPSTTWTTQCQTPGGTAIHGELVADDAPAFLNFDLASAAFFGLTPRSNNRLGMQQIVFREQDMRARIKDITVRATEVTVMLDGEARSGKRLTLGGAGGSSQRLSDDTLGVTFELPDGLQEEAWVALHEGQELLDSRVIGSRWRPGADVEFEDEPAVRLQALISQGENATFEAKCELPGNDPDRVLKTVAAFANGGGGTIVFGVDDEMQVVGLGNTLNRQTMDRVARLISDRVHPHVFCHMEQVTIGDADVLAVHIYPGPDTPYGVGTNEQKLVYYVRRSGNSIPARPEDLRNAVRARSTPPADQTGGGVL